MSARCYIIDVDGEPASVRLSKPPEQVDPAELDAVRDVIRRARQLIEDLHARSRRTARETLGLERVESELAESVAHLDALPTGHPRRIPLERRIRLLSGMVAAHQEPQR